MNLSSNQLLRYSLQLAYLSTLLEEGLINEAEHEKCKKVLMRDYGIVSDILAAVEKAS